MSSGYIEYDYDKILRLLRYASNPGIEDEIRKKSRGEPSRLEKVGEGAFAIAYSDIENPNDVYIKVDFCEELSKAALVRLYDKYSDEEFLYLPRMEFVGKHAGDCWYKTELSFDLRFLEGGVLDEGRESEFGLYLDYLDKMYGELVCLALEFNEEVFNKSVYSTIFAFEKYVLKHKAFENLYLWYKELMDYKRELGLKTEPIQTDVGDSNIAITRVDKRFIFRDPFVLLRWGLG